MRRPKRLQLASSIAASTRAVQCAARKPPPAAAAHEQSAFSLLLIPALGIADYKAVVRAGFGDPVITFFVGVLMLSAAFTRPA